MAIGSVSIMEHRCLCALLLLLHDIHCPQSLTWRFCTQPATMHINKIVADVLNKDCVYQIMLKINKWHVKILGYLLTWLSVFSLSAQPRWNTLLNICLRTRISQKERYTSMRITLRCQEAYYVFNTFMKRKMAWGIISKTVYTRQKSSGLPKKDKWGPRIYVLLCKVI